MAKPIYSDKADGRVTKAAPQWGKYKISQNSKNNFKKPHRVKSSVKKTIVKENSVKSLVKETTIQWLNDNFDPKQSSNASIKMEKELVCSDVDLLAHVMGDLRIVHCSLPTAHCSLPIVE